jgi:glycosyltransferase involved in cell wall biosynthesis
MRIVIADPPAYTPPYDHELASALGRLGADVGLLTSAFRYGARPTPDRYHLDEGLYRFSSRIGARLPRLAARAFEHPVVLGRLARCDADVVHLQWCGAPEVDAWLMRTRAPLVFTAHDLLPRRTAHRAGLWRRLFRRFQRVVVHSENGRDVLVGFGVPPDRVAVIPHPVFRSDLVRVDDGRTALVLGVLRPYKGVGDAVTATLAVPGARLLVAGDPRIPVAELQARAGARAEWRLGYLDRDELERALGEATVAVFPYRAELDQSGALLQVLGAGVPAVVYDVGGLGEVVARYGAGAVVASGDVAGLTEELRQLLDDEEALAAARAGAERARDELTWEAAARTHLDLYREVVRG